MKITPLKSKQIVDAFLRSNSTVQAEVLTDVAKMLRRKHRGGSVEEMGRLLRKAMAGNRLFEFTKEGKSYYETMDARRRRCGLPKRAPKSAYINATEPVLA